MDARTAQILNSLRTPKTYQDLSKEFDVGYYTIREHVQTLCDLGFVEEMPWPKQGTKQKQFRANAYNPENQFSPEGCAVFSLFGNSMTAMQIISSEYEHIFHDAITAIFTSLSAPMTEVIKDASMVGAPHSSVVQDKLLVVLEGIKELVSLTEQLIHSGVWGDPEAARILFDRPVENMNIEKILEVKARLFQLASDRGW